MRSITMKMRHLAGTAQLPLFDRAVESVVAAEFPERPPFVPSRFCTRSCGKSLFEDWLHTPACEAAYERDVDQEDRGDMSPPPQGDVSLAEWGEYDYDTD